MNLSKRTVLHHISNDAKFVEVSATTLCAERFFERDLAVVSILLAALNGLLTYLDVVYVVSIPSRSKEFIAESQNQDIFNHLLPEVVVDSVKLIFFPVRSQGTLKFSRTC